MSNKNESLQELGGSKYEVLDGQPNIKGWSLVNDHGKRIGKVKELIFDISSLKVRYIVADLSASDLELQSHKVLIPIGIARLEETDDNVALPGVSVNQLQLLPKYEEGNITSEMEHRVRNILNNVTDDSVTLSHADSHPNTGESDFYSHDHFNQDYSKRLGSKNSTSDTSLRFKDTKVDVESNNSTNNRTK